MKTLQWWAYRFVCWSLRVDSISVGVSDYFSNYNDDEDLVFVARRENFQRPERKR
jgi:hypothetical protein